MIRRLVLLSMVVTMLLGSMATLGITTTSTALAAPSITTSVQPPAALGVTDPGFEG